VLEEAVADLEADNRELRDQLKAVTEICEALKGDQGRAPTAVRLPQAAAAGPVAWLRRVTKTALQATVGTARRLWRAGDPGQRHVVAAVPAAAVAELPEISLVAVGSDDDGVPGLPLQGACPPGVELAAWNPATGKLAVVREGGEPALKEAPSREELLTVLAGQWLMAVPAPGPRLSPALVEDLRMLVASEPLRYIRVPLEPRKPGRQDHGADELLLCAREVFDPIAQIDLEQLAQAARSRPVLGKTVRLAGPLEAAPPRSATFAGRGRGLVVAVGRYEVWAGNRFGPVEHLTAALPVASEDIQTADPRPAVLVVVAASLDGGVDRLLASLLRDLGEEIRLVVATTSTDSALGLRRCDLLGESGAVVHELGSVLDASVWPSAVVRLARTNGIRSALVIGWDDRLVPAVDGLTGQEIEVVSLALDDEAARVPARRWLAGSGAEAGALVRAGVAEDRVAVAAVGLEEIGALRPGSYGGAQAARSELGVPEGCRLVLTYGDLVARCRPEDVVMVADRLRHREELFFAVVGEGPLGPELADLAAYMKLGNVSVQPPRRSLEDLLAAADVILDPADAAPSRSLVTAAVAAAKPVVAFTGGGIAEFGSGWLVDPAGGPEALADALERVVDGEPRTGDPEAVRKTVRRRIEAGRAALRRALLGDEASGGQG
jgi:hypothetical protein